jgi:hypothetical protein
MAYKKSEDSDMGLVDAQAEYDSPGEDNHAWHETSVDQVPAHWHSLDQRVRVRSRSVIEREHAMEGLDEELYVEVGRLQENEAHIVGRVGPGPESSDGSLNAGLLQQIGARALQLWKATLRHPCLQRR